MANHKSAEKRARQTKRRTTRNQRVKSAVRTAEKKLSALFAGKSKDEAGEILKKYMAEAMKAVSKGILKKEYAARKIGRLSKKFATLTSSAR